jgi:hypothetical protein
MAKGRQFDEDDMAFSNFELGVVFRSTPDTLFTCGGDCSSPPPGKSIVRLPVPYRMDPDRFCDEESGEYLIMPYMSTHEGLRESKKCMDLFKSCLPAQKRNHQLKVSKAHVEGGGDKNVAETLIREYQDRPELLKVLGVLSPAKESPAKKRPPPRMGFEALPYKKRYGDESDRAVEDAAETISAFEANLMDNGEFKAAWDAKVRACERATSVQRACERASV